MDIDELLLSLDARLQLTGLFQLDDGTWRVNMRLREAAKSGPPGRETDRFCHEYADGATPSAALFACFELASKNLT